MSCKYGLALLAVLLGCGLQVQAQLLPKAHFSGIYLQWGYNRDIFTNSDLHFSKEGEYDFTIHQARATDKPDFEAFWEMPLDITIPQNSLRIGVYLNRTKTWAIEVNFDHAKYVVYDDQTLRLSGQIHGEKMDEDTVIRRHFVHFEHTNGANFLHLNYVHQHFLSDGKRFATSYLLKGGAGVVVPRSDVTIMNHRLDNEYHVAGYIISAEAGLRCYPWHNIFFEMNAKGGFANYTNVVTVDGGGAHHHFWYGEIVGLIGYDLDFGHHRQRPSEINR